MQKFFGGLAGGSVEEQQTWAPLFLPSAGDGRTPQPSETERAALVASSWGKGDPSAAKRELADAHVAQLGSKGIPWARFPALTAPGVSGERYEHFQDCMSSKEFGPRKRLKRALDRLAYAWVALALPPSTRWLLDTSLMWLSKEHNGCDVEDSDEVWLVEAREEAIFAEVDERGVICRDYEEVKALLGEVSGDYRSFMMCETIGECVQQLCPENWEFVLRKLQDMNVSKQA